MTAVGRPPVNEVVLSVAFENQSVLVGPQILVTLGELLEEFPQVEEQMPYEMQAEHPIEDQLMQPQGPQVKFFAGNGPVERRYWLTQEDDSSFLLQVQSNYFALNWRDRVDGQRYPGFHELLGAFRSRFDQLNTRTHSRSSEPIRIQHAELSYIDLINPNPVWSNHSEIGNLLNVSSPALAAVEQLNFAYSRTISRDGKFEGRLHTVAQTGYQLKSDEVALRPLTLGDLSPVVNLSFTARSGRLEGNTVDHAVTFFELAHDEITDSFRSLATQAALKEWGLE